MKYAMIFTIIFLFFRPDPAAVAARSRSGEGGECPSRVMVLVESIQPGDFTEYRHYEVAFAPESAVAVTPRAGMVTDIKVSDGDRVSCGYVLVMLNEGMAEELESVNAELARWKETLWKREHWKERNPRAEAEAKGRIAEIEARLQELSAVETAVEIPSPITGIVELMVTPGTEVNAGEEVARVVNPRRKWGTLEVQVEDTELFFSGREIPLETGVTATVMERRGEQVTLLVEDMADRLGTGEKPFRILKRNIRDAIALERDRILKDDAGSHVFLVNGETACRINIEIAAEYSGRVLVSAGMGPGDLLITAHLLSRRTGETDGSLRCLSDGKRILIMQRNPESGRYEKYAGEVPVRTPEIPGGEPDSGEETGDTRFQDSRRE